MINFTFALTITISKYSLIKDDGLTALDLGGNDITAMAALDDGS